MIKSSLKCILRLKDKENNTISLFPGALPAAGSASPSDTLAAAGHTSLHNTVDDEARALGTKVGTGASTPTSGTVLRGNGVGTSAWGQAVLTSDVSGILPVANGGLGQGSLTAVPLVSPAITGTVSGGATYTSPTLTTPTIADLTNATHTHASTAQGGNIPFAGLLPTIFSGQVTTYANPGDAGGTFYYINLGGIKLFWGTTANTVGAASPSTYTVTLPVGFFTTIQSVNYTVAPGNTTNQQNAIGAGGGVSITSLGINVWASTTTSAEPVNVFVIGT